MAKELTDNGDIVLLYNTEAKLAGTAAISTSPFTILAMFAKIGSLAASV